MRSKKIISLILTFLMILSLLPQGIVTAEENDKEFREVYLHAQGENPLSTPNLSTVYSDETVNVYFAVDNPNKGDYENGEHKEPQYDMNGYTVKIYFDPAYLDFKPTSKTNAANPIDYTIPDKNLQPEKPPHDESVGDEDPVETPSSIGYFVYKHGSGTSTINGKTYKTAYATIFFSGEYVPQKSDSQLWYNLCALPLEPQRTGSTDVFLEIGTADPYTLELFAKNVNDDYAPNFKFTAVNGGYHHINIKDKLKPAAPVADPISGSYTEAQKVTLTAEDDCDIYYSTDGINYIPYTQPVDVDRSVEIFCYAQRKSDGKMSNTVSYEYKIIPNPPYLFDEDEKNKIPNVYTQSNSFRVYVSDKESFGTIDDGTSVYYTFASLTAEDVKSGGTDPETQWVEVTRPQDYQYINIDRKRTVKLISVKSSAYGVEKSDISWYYLGIKPAPVTAEPESGIYDETQHITLSTKTPDAQIFYTTNNTDPRENGIPYTVPLTLNKDATIRAVAFYDGEWSEISSYWYVFNIIDDYGVDAFYPSGVYEGSVNVTLTPNNPQNEIKYSVDGGETWQDYTDVISVDRNTEIIAKAIDANGNEGGEYRFTYTIMPMPPEFAPESTQFTNADEISIYSPERTNDNYRDYDLIYTLDGSDPLTSSNAKIADQVSDSAIIPISGYTVVKAVVRRWDDNHTVPIYSTVVTHSYDIVVSKPVKPLTTLTPGNYTREIGGKDYVTQFTPVPTGTTIYYTISYGDNIKSDPVPNTEGTFEYVPGTDIEIKGKTIIKAVAVNMFGAKSDIGIFEYTITPEAPIAAPSSQITGEKLPVVPVDAVVGSTVKYTVGDFENEFVNDDDERFYIDISTGNAYRDEECTILLGDESDTENDDLAMLVITSVLDGVESQPNTYIYTLNDNEDKVILAPPYADKKSGTYEEIRLSETNNNILRVTLNSLNHGDEIQYMINNSGDWKVYDGTPLELDEYTVLQLRSKKGDSYSASVSYVYEFIPLAPIITLPSGSYTNNPVQTTELMLDPRAPDDKRYYIFYRANGDSNDARYDGVERRIDHTQSFKAYVINRDSGEKSKNTIHYYIIESANVTGGSVYTAYPYEVNPGDTKFIASHLLDDEDYNDGIKLYTQNKDAKIKYFYTYTKADGSITAATETFVYDNALPIFVNSSMADITITAWLIDEDGGDIADTQSTFKYVFVDLKVPSTTLEGKSTTKFTKGTEYSIINDYPDDKTIFIYYTLDGSDPSNPANANRLLYTDETELEVDGDTVLKTVYFRACGTNCGECKDDENYLSCTKGVYGEVGKYKYTIKDTKGGGGGSSPSASGNVTVDNSRKYTIDIFGNEHPTHVGYINGYPDGSVQPDGMISREEISAILYRIDNTKFDNPIESTGSVFPDVEPYRWSVKEVEYMASKGVVEGYPDGNFVPAGKLTRAEFAAMICRFTSLEQLTDNKFSDLSQEHWAYEYILKLANSNLVEGYEDGTFRPDRQISRAEVMTVINKILGRRPSDPYVKSLHYNPFNDLNIDKWYYVTVLEATITHNYYLNSNGIEYKWEDWVLGK